jgi:hypothetical protein
MLHMFHTYVAMLYPHVAYVSNDFQVFQTYALSVSSIFERMLQVLHPDVLKVDRILHMGCVWKVERGASGPTGTGPWVGL